MLCRRCNSITASLSLNSELFAHLRRILLLLYGTDREQPAGADQLSRPGQPKHTAPRFPLQRHGPTALSPTDTARPAPPRPRTANSRRSPPRRPHLVAQRLVDVRRQLSGPPLRLQLHGGRRGAAGAWAEGRKRRRLSAGGTGRAAPRSPLPRSPAVKRDQLPLSPRGPAAPRPSWPSYEPAAQLRLVKSCRRARGPIAPQQRAGAAPPTPTHPTQRPRRGLARGT